MAKKNELVLQRALHISSDTVVKKRSNGCGVKVAGEAVIFQLYIGLGGEHTAYVVMSKAAFDAIRSGAKVTTETTESVLESV